MNIVMDISSIVRVFSSSVMISVLWFLCFISRCLVRNMMDRLSN